MKKITLLIVLIITVGLSNGQTLTKEQKLEDFEYLYETLQDNYPYFGVLERQYNVKWLDQRPDFIRTIEETKTDKDFIMAISDILSNLHSGHTDIAPTFYRNFFITSYKQIDSRNIKWENWLINLNKGNDYWTELLGIEDLVFNQEEGVPYDDELLSCFILDTNNIAVIKIKSFLTSQIGKDAERIGKFIEKIEHYPNLIVDIQDNGGGNYKYWSENIVPLLSVKDIVYHYCPIKTQNHS